jgi:hypothetical protein
LRPDYQNQRILISLTASPAFLFHQTGSLGLMLHRFPRLPP